MVVYVLSLQADLQGVDTIALSADADLCISVRNPLDHSEVREQIMVDRSSFQESASRGGGNNQHAFNKGDVTAAEHHHHSNQPKKHVKHPEAPCHFALKWQGATQRSTMRVLDEASDDVTKSSSSGRGKKKAAHGNSHSHSTIAPALTAKDSGQPVRLLRLECDGMEPYAFHLTGRELVVTNKAGVVYEDDLTWSEAGDWSAYDMGSGTTRVSNLVGRFD
jgi:hypothetical protein